MKDNQPMSPNKQFETIRPVITSAIVIGEPGQDIVNLVKRDHQPLKDLIPRLRDTSVKRAEKAQDVEKFIFLLMRHADAEEKSLYVHMKQHQEREYLIQALEGDTEHGMATTLIHEINGAADDNEWTAKVKVLAEMIEHHIKEEEKEGGVLDHVSQMDEEMLFSVGAEYMRLVREFEAVNFERPARIIQYGQRPMFN